MLAHMKYLYLDTSALTLTAATVVGQQQTQFVSDSVETCSHCSSTPIDIERGRPNGLVDGVGWVLGIPSKLTLWNRRADNHDVSPETEERVAEYMAVNDLGSTKVRVNQYHPLDDWKRLRQNKQVGAGWRYTFGVLQTAGETILPGRLFGGDRYNPYTNTVHVYSDLPSLAMEQSAYAKDVQQRTYPGTYAAFQSLPLIGLWHERRSKQFVFDHVDTYGNTSDRVEARKVLQAQYGVEVGGQIGGLVPPAQTLVTLTGAVVGHTVGHVQGLRITAGLR